MELGKWQKLRQMISSSVGNDEHYSYWRRIWQPTPVFLPGEPQGRGEPGGLLSLGSHRVRHNISLVVQWLRVHLPAQRTQVQSLFQEDPKGHGETEPTCYSY